MRLSRVAGSVLIAGLFAATVLAQAPPAALTDRELRAHLDSLGRKLDDPLTDVGTRERLALEMAATLDRAARAAPEAEARRAHWAEAAAILERFLDKNHDRSQEAAFKVQAGVYLWARARTWM